MDENIQATLSYNRANMEWKNGWKFLLVGCSQILNHTATHLIFFSDIMIVHWNVFLNIWGEK